MAAEVRNNMTTPKKPRTKLKPFRAWVIAEGAYRFGPVLYERLLAFGSRDGAADYITLNHLHGCPEPVEVLCTPVAPRKRKGKRK
jgi:hypothetical protein